MIHSNDEYNPDFDYRALYNFLTDYKYENIFNQTGGSDPSDARDKEERGCNKPMRPRPDSTYIKINFKQITDESINWGKEYSSTSKYNTYEGRYLINFKNPYAGYIKGNINTLFSSKNQNDTDNKSSKETKNWNRSRMIIQN